MKKFTWILKNGGLFLILLALTFYIILKDNSPAQLAAAVRSADYRFLLLAVLAMSLFLICEGINLSRCLRLFDGGRSGSPIGLGKGIKYALIGFFFSSVTPSASGGQPMQLYFIHRDGISVSHGTLALLFELLSFQTVTISLAAAGFIYQRHTIAASMGNMQYLLLIGVGLNLLVMAVLVLAIFSEKMIVWLAGLVIKLIKIFSREKAESVSEKLETQILEYRSSAVHLRRNKGIFLKTLATTLVQILAMYTVPYLIYKGFGLSGYTAGEIIALQAVLYVAVSALPLPGALGVSESAFMILFKTLFTADLLAGAMMLSRGVSFYLFVLISGIASAIFFIIRKKGKDYGLQHFDCRGRQGYCGAAETVPGE